MCELIPVLILPIVGLVWCVLCILYILIPIIIVNKMRKEYNDSELYELFHDSPNVNYMMMDRQTHLRFHKILSSNQNNIDRFVGSLRKQYKYVLIGLPLCLLAMASTMTYFVSYCGTN